MAAPASAWRRDTAVGRRSGADVPPPRASHDCGLHAEETFLNRHIEFTGFCSPPPAGGRGGARHFAYPGRTQAVVVNQDRSMNSVSNPAARGEIVTLFATGEGQTAPAGSAVPLGLTVGGVSSAAGFTIALK